MQKDFYGWNELKKMLDGQVLDRCPAFKSKELWMCYMGLNIGHEQDGQGSMFLRPVLIFKIINNETFLGIPITTKIRESSDSFKFNLGGMDQFAILSQIRLFSVKRLKKIITVMPEKEFEELLLKFNNFMPKSKISLSGEVVVVAAPPLPEVS